MHAAPIHPELPSQSSRDAPSFAEALSAIPSWTDLAEARRRDFASALHSAARFLALPPATIPCDPAWLNQRLFQRTPATFGISQGRFRNIVSGLRAVLRRLGTHALDRRSRCDLPADWQALLAAVPRPGPRGALAALARHCATLGIPPEATDDALLAALVAAERGSRLSAATDGRARKIAAAWNACVRAGLPDWPSHTLAAARVREPYALRLDAYPESLQQEVAAFEARLACREGRFLIGGSSHRRLRPATTKARIFSIRQAAGLLVRSGLPAGEIRGLQDLVQPIERVALVLEALAEAQAARSGEAQPEGGQLAQVAETLRQLAVYHVELDPAAVKQITEWAREAQGRRRRKGMTRKNRDRLRALVPLHRRGLLLHLPRELMRRARELGTGTAEAGRLARTAVAIEILLVCPLRRRSMLALRLDEHLQRLDPRGRRITHLVLQPEDMKNDTPMEWPLPPEAAALVDEYIRAFRPALAKPDNLWLFPSGPGVLSENRFSEAVESVIAREVGADVNVHLMRHFAAWLHLKAHPGAYEDIRRVLGHRSLETTIGNYIAFEAAMSAERFDAVVLDERKATRAVAAAKWGRRGSGRRGGSRA
ncbi:site-specific integrase [Falsiroseomonas sp.]|uniref:site-specific integrase n=1 Tax=Falsiroseomonas sp. TaxID=2870721 RepID=UPI0027189235|nr:site-specific integrase [Falsiroseomonas sp.]MDO9498486.1 site-specific integrase [Falsiroseomonas sp.]